MKIFNQIVFFLFVLCTAHPLYAVVITSLSLAEKDGVTTNNYPLTFGHVFKQGDVSSGIEVKYNGVLLATQFDKKTSWPDGSVKIGVISVVIPKVLANGTGSLSIQTASPNTTSGAMDKAALLASDIESNINLSNLSGSGHSGTTSSSLRAQINSGDLNYWLQGPICTEVLEHQQINANLDAAWEARFYPGTSYGIRISNSIENVNPQSIGDVVYNVTINQGNTTPTQVYTRTGYTHLYGSRWRKVYWLGAKPPETELHYDTNYLASTGAILHYDTSSAIPESAIASEYAAWLASSRDIDGNGLMLKGFATTGGRREIGPLPSWSALYLLTMDNRMKDIVTGQSEIAGHVPQIHWRETNQAMGNYGGVVSIDDRVGVDLFRKTGLTAPVGEMTNNGWQVDRSHHGSFAYLAYLITGEYWHYQETMFWGGFVLAWDSYRRNGEGSVQNFSTGKDSTYGIFYDQERGVAWSMRTLSDALFASLDTTTYQNNYFKTKLNNNIEWLWLANQPGKHGVHAFRGTRETDLTSTAACYKWAKTIAPWMHDYNVIVMRHVKDQKTTDEIKTAYLLSHWSYFTVGRFTHHPTFNKWDGAGYYWPLAESGGKTYYNEGDWEGLWANVVEADTCYSKQGVPHSDYTRYTSSTDSPLSIAMAALACSIDQPKKEEAYAFARENLDLTMLLNRPTWLLMSSESGMPKPSILSIIKL